MPKMVYYNYLMELLHNIIIFNYMIKLLTLKFKYFTNMLFNISAS